VLLGTRCVGGTAILHYVSSGKPGKSVRVNCFRTL